MSWRRWAPVNRGRRSWRWRTEVKRGRYRYLPIVCQLEMKRMRTSDSFNPLFPVQARTLRYSCPRVIGADIERVTNLTSKSLSIPFMTSPSKLDMIPSDYINHSYLDNITRSKINSEFSGIIKWLFSSFRMLRTPWPWKLEKYGQNKVII